jgi:redox-sensing transcriptional repressor
VNGTIPEPAGERFIRILRILEGGEQDRTYTSAELEALTGWSSQTIRKDISCLGLAKSGSAEPAPASGNSAGYEPRRLVARIRETLGLDRRRKICVVGLGRLGSAYLNLDAASLGEFELAAGFDSNTNRVEILASSVPLYPSYKMGEVISRLDIEIALLCVPAQEAQTAAEKLAAAGIRGILNFAPVNLAPLPSVMVRNVYVTDELRALSVKLELLPLVSMGNI